jgi:predicted esterase
VTLAAGTADETVDPVASSDLAAFLAGRGWNVALESVPDATHMSILDSAGQEAVMDTVGLAYAAANALDQVSGVSGS